MHTKKTHRITPYRRIFETAPKSWIQIFDRFKPKINAVWTRSNEEMKKTKTVPFLPSTEWYKELQSNWIEQAKTALIANYKLMQKKFITRFESAIPIVF